MENLVEKIELHDILNPKLWDPDNKLDSEVSEKLHEIVDQFILELEENDIPIKVLDAHLVGSNASFNYTDESDLDVHVVANFEDVTCDPTILNLLYNFFKKYFNDKYEISIHGVPVELYVEDVNAATISNGIYSLFNDEWIKFPEPIEVPDIDITDDLEPYEDRYDEIMEERNVEKAEELVNELYLLRKNALAAEGEYSVGNLVFKEFRNLGYLDGLKQLTIDERAKELSLESLNEEQENNNVKDIKEHFDDQHTLDESSTDGDWGYHYGDLGKADYRHQFGNRNTGGFGTGVYFVGKPVNQRKDAMGYKGRPEHIIDLSKYNLYKPKDNNQAYKLHDALLYLNNYSVATNEVPATWDDILDEYEEVFDEVFLELNSPTGNKPVKLNTAPILRYIRKYIEYYPHKITDVDYDSLRDIAKEIEERRVEESQKFYNVINNLYSALNYSVGEDRLIKVVKSAIEDTSDTAPATLIMQKLGYDGIDVRHLNKDDQGLQGLDNFGYGSVLYDLKESVRG